MVAGAEDLWADVTAVILAGGVGSRLRAAVSDRPKGLAEVNGRPFLAFLLDQLADAGLPRVVLCTGYLAGQIRAAFGGEHRGMQLAYSHEETPLGTGGALRLAVEAVADRTLLVLNGDSYCEVDLKAAYRDFLRADRRPTLVLSRQADTSRFGRVECDAGSRVAAFLEKGQQDGPGWINAGIYLVERPLVAAIPTGRAVSLERDVFPGWIPQGLRGFPSAGRFLDIGTPESYAQAASFFGSPASQAAHGTPAAPIDRESRVLVAGGETLIGAAIVQTLSRRGFTHVLHPSAADCPLTEAAAVEDFFARNRPEYVFVAAGKSGGIEANRRYPADLMVDNLLTATHLCTAALRHGTTKLLYLASSCCYPKECPQPMRVEHLGTGALEPTSAAYATAKLAGVALCQSLRQQHGARLIAGIPADVFGTQCRFDAENSHVIPALIARMHAAKLAGDPAILLWGTGAPRREFLFADDLAEACLVAMDRYDAPEPINLGGGTELTIRDVAALIAAVVGYRGEIRFDTSRPDGAPRKLLDSSRLLGLGWTPSTDIRAALEATYAAFVAQQAGRRDAVAEARKGSGTA